MRVWMQTPACDVTVLPNTYNTHRLSSRRTAVVNRAGALLTLPRKGFPQPDYMLVQLFTKPCHQCAPSKPLMRCDIRPCFLSHSPWQSSVERVIKWVLLIKGLKTTSQRKVQKMSSMLAKQCSHCPHFRYQCHHIEVHLLCNACRKYRRLYPSECESTCW